MNPSVRAARRAVTMICALALVGLLPTAAAEAKVSITGLVAKPIAANASCSTSTSAATESQAGANKDLCVAMAFDGGGDGFGGGDDVKDLKVSLPSGQVGGATATPLCSLKTFTSTNGCPKSTQVGDASGRIETLITLPENILEGQIFNLEPRGQEAARLGVQLQLAGLASVQRVETVVTLRADGGLDATATGLPRTFIGLPIEIRRFNLKLWGSKEDHPSLKTPFVVNSTDCAKPAVTKLEIGTAQGGTSTATASYQPTGCDKLKFTPSMLLEGDHAADSPGAITAGMTFPAQKPGELSQAHVKTANVVLPQGYELSGAAGSEPGFVGCADEDFAITSTTPANCPAGSQVGTVVFSSPLIANPLSGVVYLAKQRPGASPIRLFIFAQTGDAPEAVRIKLSAIVVPDPNTGQLSTQLENLPPVPFTSFRLTFRGGDTAIVSGPRSCGTRTGYTEVVPDNGGPVAKPSADITVDKGCDSVGGFNPELATSLKTTQAASPTVLTADLNRPSGSSRMKAATFHLPAGFSGRLTAAEQCPVGPASAGECGADSRVGAVTVRVGAGPVPSPIDGNVYLTAPQQDGDLAGLSIVVPGQFGPLNFGNLVVLARIVVRPDIGLDIVVKDIPQRVYGIDVNLRQMKLTLDRDGFGLNATSCAPMATTATLTSDLGQTADVSAPYQATGCENVPYEPTLSATLVGGRSEVGVNGHPELRTSVGAGLGQGGTKSVAIILPDGIAIDVERIKRSCPIADYNAGTCKPEAVVGSAVAESPLIPQQLAGNVTFVQVPGVPLPELRVDLKGPLAITLAGKVKQQGTRLVAEITGLPDTPLTTFALTLNGGTRGLIQASRDLCATPTLPIDADFASFTGATKKRTLSVDIPDCAPGATIKVGALGKGKPTFDARIVGGRTAVTSTKLTLPSGMTFASSKKLRKLVKVSATGLKKGSKASLKVTRSTVTLSVPKGQSATVLRLRLKAGGLAVTKRLRSRGRPKLAFRLQSSLADGRRPSLRVTARPAANPQG